jgi:hypothetical protein
MKPVVPSGTTGERRETWTPSFLRERRESYEKPKRDECPLRLFVFLYQKDDTVSHVAAVFIDGGYLDKVIHHDFGNRRIDYGKLAQEIVQPAELFRAYYFTTALSFLPRFEVRLGRLVKRGYEADGTPIFIQKRVDCMVGVDMALLAAKGKITHVALISGDSDLVPAIEAVKRESVLVTLWHGSYSRDTRPSRELVEICDDRKEFTPELINRILRQ